MFVDCFASLPLEASSRSWRPRRRCGCCPPRGVPGEVAGPTAEVAPAAATGGVVPPPSAGEGEDPAPPSASSADPAVQGVAPWGPRAGKVIDLDNDKAEGTAAVETGTDVPAAATGMAAAMEEGEPAPVATMGTAAAGEAGTPAPVAATEEAVATETGTSARGAMAEVAPTAEVEVPTPEALTGAETPASAVAMEGGGVDGRARGSLDGGRGACAGTVGEPGGFQDGGAHFDGGVGVGSRLWLGHSYSQGMERIRPALVIS
ncbi:myristoylated alanine-rich C-kinase substrate-like [Setaria italica]|uniref:myristoylated alanine-rich C-kinase substrate-like n=1 Tax=Setaria italica TaxID=4555 RepID=UPI000350D86F|nr:myristoylated alanine-rich C-kinase substrate-like [Setaria italica]